MQDQISGVLPILHTPFCDDDQIDRVSLQRQINWAFAQGVRGVCSAMVSEIRRLCADERILLNRLLVEQTAGRGPVIASVGAESTKQAVTFATAAAECGCSAVMAIPPLTTSLPESALFDYLSAIAKCVDLPVIIQDASSYVGASMSPDFYVRLLKEFGVTKILFKPEGNPAGPNISKLRDASGGEAKIFDGSGGNLLIDAWRRGVTGTMPGVDLLDGIVAIWNALQAHDELTAYRIYFPICALVALQMQAGLDGFLAIEKYIMVRRGLFDSARRRTPNSWEIDPETQREVDRLLDMLEEALLQNSNSDSK